ncbi:hypothetical protein [Mycolicibacterium sp. XJ879]
MCVEPDNTEFDASPNDAGGVDDTLRPMEATDSDDVRNDEGDEVVDPPEEWAAADHIAAEPDGESLDEKLAAERPDQTPRPSPQGTDDVERIDPESHGRSEGDVDGAPEDGSSIFPVVE